MAVPKGKVSKSRRDARRASNWKVSTPSIVECPNCHEATKPHTVCKKCGYYKGRQVLELKKDKKESN